MAEESEALRIRRENLTWREVGGEVIALDLVSSTYFSTNKTGSILWRALVDGSSVDALVALLQERFGVSKEVAAADVRAFLDGVAAHGLLQNSDNGPG